WHFADRFLPFYAQDLPSHVYEQSESVLSAARLWADSESRAEYLQQVLWRTQGKWSFTRPANSESYFRPELISPTAGECFVDCGAFDGDTLRSFLSYCGSNFTRFVAIEPDPKTFLTLKTFVSHLPPRVREKVETVECAVGATEATLALDAR